MGWRAGRAVPWRVDARLSRKVSGSGSWNFAQRRFTSSRSTEGGGYPIWNRNAHSGDSQTTVNDEVPGSVVAPRKQTVEHQTDEGLDQRLWVLCCDP
jgi:hypothetical protein